MFSGIGSIAQFGYVVDDLQREIQRWNEKGAGNFLVYNDISVPLQYRDNDTILHLSIALAQFDGVQIELIQQHDRVGSAFTDTFADNWPSGDNGFHHIGMVTNDFDRSCAHLTDDGFVKVMGGEFGGYRFAYYDTRAKLGFFLELFEGNEAMRAFFDTIKNA